MIKEEDRLSAVISEIDRDVCIVPRGAYVKSPNQQVHENRSFEGLTVAEAAKLGNYMHMREAEKLAEKSLLQKADLDKPIDFMDTCDEDVPKGKISPGHFKNEKTTLVLSLEHYNSIAIQCMIYHIQSKGIVHISVHIVIIFCVPGIK